MILIVSVTILILEGRPAIFSQARPGLHGIPFRVYKFRTMTMQSDANGKLLPDRQRLTAIGAFLRKFSLDELPQLVNVLKGDLSLVGPRPLLMEYLPLYTKEQARRHDVRPGISGWAQVNGRNAISWEEKFKLDVWYVDHHSFWLDIKIILKTISNVVRSEGIAQHDHVTMAKFTGKSGE